MNKRSKQDAQKNAIERIKAQRSTQLNPRALSEKIIQGNTYLKYGVATIRMVNFSYCVELVWL